MIVIIFPLLTEKKSQRHLSQLSRDSLTTQLIQTDATVFHLGVKHGIRERTGVGHASTSPLSIPSTDTPISYSRHTMSAICLRSTAKVPSARGGASSPPPIVLLGLPPVLFGDATILLEPKKTRTGKTTRTRSQLLQFRFLRSIPRGTILKELIRSNTSPPIINAMQRTK